MNQGVVGLSPTSTQHSVCGCSHRGSTNIYLYARETASVGLHYPPYFRQVLLAAAYARLADLRTSRNSAVSTSVRQRSWGPDISNSVQLFVAALGI